MADLFKQMRDLNEELRPNIRDLEKDTTKVEVQPEAKVEQPKVVQEEPLSSEELAEMDLDEREVAQGKEVGELTNRSDFENRNASWEGQGQVAKKEVRAINNTIQEMENEFNKSKVLLQGATNSNKRFGGLHPWHTALAKIETVEDRQNLRTGKEMLLAASAMFGIDSDIFAYTWEDYLGEISYTRAAQGFAAKLEKSNITQSTVDKNVKTARTQSKDSIVNNLQPGYSPYG